MIIACTCFVDEFCEEFPHNLLPTPGYWIECSRQKIASDNLWDESGSEHELLNEEEELEGGEVEAEKEDAGVSGTRRMRDPGGGKRGGRRRGTEEGEEGCRVGFDDEEKEDEEEEEEEEEEDLEEELERKKTVIEEQWEKNQCFELTSVEQETYEKYFYGTEHWNYFTNDEDLGPVILSIKQETLNNRDQFSNQLA
ncbi:hypothetical protein J437_LFUL004811 [Ladona fulva]|uniref:Uncharacterized protein n=1 Tax=Ladona fulva TaxID=123851 RepID=A0A8K0K107_LADFU|nr:hypothetical protein J437_LFUL004811 [Ladona fulva]